MTYSAYSNRCRQALHFAEGLRWDPIYAYFFGTNPISFLALWSFFADELRYRLPLGQFLLVGRSMALVGRSPQIQLPAEALSRRTRVLTALAGRKYARRWHEADSLGVTPATTDAAYLSALVTPRRYRCQNYATMLLELLKAEDSSILLEAGSEENVFWYRRRGFSIVSKRELPGGPAIWVMRWAPGQDDGRSPERSLET